MLDMGLSTYSTVSINQSINHRTEPSPTEPSPNTPIHPSIPNGVSPSLSYTHPHLQHIHTYPPTHHHHHRNPPDAPPLQSPHAMHTTPLHTREGGGEGALRPSGRRLCLVWVCLAGRWKDGVGGCGPSTPNPEGRQGDEMDGSNAKGNARQVSVSR